MVSETPLKNVQHDEKSTKRARIEPRFKEKHRLKLPHHWSEFGRRINPYRRSPTPNLVTRMKRVLYKRVATVLDRYGVRPRPLNVEKYLGASIGVVLDWVETQFTPENEFDWENYGSLWQLDHRIPIGRDNGSVSQVIRKLHYTNLQPLERTANAAKAANPPNGKARVLFRRLWFE